MISKEHADEIRQAYNSRMILLQGLLEQEQAKQAISGNSAEAIVNGKIVELDTFMSKVCEILHLTKGGNKDE